MKPLFKTIIPAGLVAVMAVAADSCTGSAAKDSIEFETRTDSVGYLVPDYYGDSVYSAARYSVVWPERIGEQDFNALNDSLTMLTFGVKGEDFAEASKTFTRAGLNDLVQDSDSGARKYDVVPFEVAFDAQRTNLNLINSEVTLLTPDVLVIGVLNQTYYYGAAHGMMTRRFLNYSIKNHALMTVANTFVAGNEKSILSLIEHAAHEKYPDEGVLFDTPIESFANFQITENDIVFVYQPYDIGPYSSGILEIPVSQNDLYRFLTPEAIATLGLDD